MQFIKPIEEMTWHLKPFFIRAYFNGKSINHVFIDGGAVLNVMPITTLKKLGKSKLDLISTNIKMTNFTSKVTDAIELLVANVTVGPKMLSLAFFVVDAKLSYFVLLGRDWIHFNQSVPLTLYQLLIF